MTVDRGPQRLTIEELKTRSPGELEAWLKKILGRADNFAIDGDASQFSLSQSYINFGKLAVGRGTCTGFQFETDIPSAVMVGLVTAGSVTATAGGKAVTAIPREQAIVVKPGRRTHIKHSSGTHGFGILVPLESLKKHAESLFGRTLAVGDDSEFVSAVDLTQGPGAALKRNIISSVSEITTLAESGLSEIAAAGSSDLLLSLALVSVMPDARELMDLKPQAAAKPAFDRARDYLSAHAGDPISLSDLAKDLGVSLRSLQIEFQRRLGRSPLEYLFECRLQLARSMLLGAVRGETVTQVATKSGFTNLGAFAARYRETFGELPSETLARAVRK